MAMPNATIENTGVKVITAVICKNAAMIPIIKLAMKAMPVQSRLFPQLTIDIEFTSFTNNVCRKVLAGEALTISIALLYNDNNYKEMM